MQDSGQEGRSEEVDEEEPFVAWRPVLCLATRRSAEGTNMVPAGGPAELASRALAMSNFAVTLAANRPWWLLLLAAAAGAGLVFYSYRPHITSFASARKASERSGRVLLALRGALVLMLLLFIFRPVVGFELRSAPRARAAVLVDKSLSMSVFDHEGLPDRFTRACGALLEGALDELSSDFEAKVFVFEAAAKALDRPRGLLSEEPDGGSTDIVGALEAAFGSLRAEGAEPAMALLLTDGVQTSERKRTPEEAARSLRAPVHAVGVGSRPAADGSLRDVRIASVKVPQSVPVKSTCKVRVFVEAYGYGGRTVQVRLLEGDRERGAASLALDDLAGAQEVSISLRPEETGQHAYSVEIPVDVREQIRWNNEKSFFVNITDPSVRVLYVEGAVRPEFRFLRRFMERDPQMDPVCLIKVKRGLFRQMGAGGERAFRSLPRAREEFERFDVIVIGDLDSSHFGEAGLRALAGAVKEGGKGILMTQGAAGLGRGGYGEGPLSTVLPVGLPGRDAEVEPGRFRMVLTDRGRAHPVFEGLEGSFAPDSTFLPPFEVMNVVKPSDAPGAAVLAVRRDGPPGGSSAPVVAVGRAGSGRALVMAAGPTWPWCTVVPASREPSRALASARESARKGGGSPFARFWGQALRWLAGREEERGAGVSAWLDRGEALYAPGESVTIYARASSESGELVSGAEVTARIGKSAREGEEPSASLKLSPSPGRPGTYETVFRPEGAGLYRIALKAGSRGGRRLGEAVLRFQVEPPPVEGERLDLDEEALRRIADASGGQYVPLEGLNRLVRRLKARRAEERRAVVIPLWNGPLMFLIFVAFAGLEWHLRRSRQLA